jgi:magnesium transporter
MEPTTKTDEELDPTEIIEEHLLNGRYSEAAKFVNGLDPETGTLVLSRQSQEHLSRFMINIGADESSTWLQRLPLTISAQTLETLSPTEFAQMIDHFPIDQLTVLLEEMDDSVSHELLSELPDDTAQTIRLALKMPDDSAGSLLIDQYVKVRTTDSVGKVVDDLHTRADELRDFEVQYIYVTDSRDKLVGVIRMRDLLFASKGTQINDIMISQTISVDATMTLNELVRFFDDHNFVAVPVTKKNGRLIGIVLQRAARASVSNRIADDYRKAAGLIEEELRTMPVGLRAKRRLKWLTANIGLNIAAASIIAAHQDTLTQMIALAVFLPIISDMSGCSGNQAVAVTMRELSLGLVRPTELARVFSKELGVGIINGVILGILIGLAAYLWKGTATLGLIVGCALAINTAMAVCLGGTIPLFLKKINRDPALASGPLLTTMTDMMGFFLVLSFASLSL